MKLRPNDNSRLWWILTSKLAGSTDDFRHGLSELAHGAVERPYEPALAYANRGEPHAEVEEYERAEVLFGHTWAREPFGKCELDFFL